MIMYIYRLTEPYLACIIFGLDDFQNKYPSQIYALNIFLPFITILNCLDGYPGTTTSATNHCAVTCPIAYLRKLYDIVTGAEVKGQVRAAIASAALVEDGLGMSG